MIASLAVGLALQDADLGERLKSGGWSAVEKADPKDKAKLGELAKSEDKELQWWAGAALAELDARAKGGEGFIAPRRVTLEANDRPARDVLNDLFKPEGLVLAKGGDGLVTVSFKETPFHQAVDEVCRQARLDLRRPGPCELAVSGDDEYVPGPADRRHYGGPFAFEFTSSGRGSIQKFTGEPERRFSLSFTVRADPRAWIENESLKWTLVAAADDTGLSLHDPGRSEIDPSWSGIQPAIFWIAARLKPPAPGATRVTVRGFVTLKLARKPVEVVFDKAFDVTEAVTKTAGSVTVAFNGIRPHDEEGYWVGVKASAANPAALPRSEDLIVEDAEGRLSSAGEGNSNEGSLFFRFQPVGRPERVRVRVYPDGHERRVYFEWKDVPIR